jgi:thioredoxin reductase
MSNLYDAIIVGGGAAGLAAAIHCGTFGMLSLMLNLNGWIKHG